MTGIQRIKNILLGVVTILFSILMIAVPEGGLVVVALLISVSLFIYAVKTLVFYFSMARHMVGGRTMLYIGIIVLDFAVFVMMLTNIPRIYIILYLLAIHAFSGAIDILRSFEAKKYQASSWKFSMVSGVVNIIVAILCVVFIGSELIIIYIYCAGLIYSAMVRIITSFRKTAIVYIQ